MAGEKVQLYVYDLSGGLARQMSMSFLGKQVDGIWHTGVVVSGTEYYFGGGIQKARAGTTHFGRPAQVVDLGTTEVPHEVREELIADLASRFHAETYDLLSNNCNNFSNELALLLTGNGIPEHIVNLPSDVMSTPFGQFLQPMLSQMQNRLGSVTEGSAVVAPSRPAAPPATAPRQSRPEPTPVTAPKSSSSVDTAKVEFENAVKREFAALVAQGVLPNEAATKALQKVKQNLPRA
ncbi:hypothetical protein BSKO_11313 [Bryopsis sp. KO-2023]|nr:hypothetical protein BSKO_11313 [Bryopsis sp. KO-2023]